MSKQIFWSALLMILLFSSALPVAAHGDDDPVDDHDSSILSSAAQLPLVLGAVLVGGAAAGGIQVTQRRKLTGFQLVVIGLGVATGLIHLIVGLRGDPLLILNGLGYLGLIGLLYLPLPIPSKFRVPLLIGLLVYTLITLIGYFLTHTNYDTVGLIAKAIELFLIVALIVRIRYTLQSENRNQPGSG